MARVPQAKIILLNNDLSFNKLISISPQIKSPHAIELVSPTSIISRR